MLSLEFYCRSLIKINLSFNWIEDVSGFSDFKGASYQLRHVELQGNRITSIPHLVSNLQKCVTLQELVIAQGRVDNPICHVSGNLHFKKKHTVPAFKKSIVLLLF